MARTSARDIDMLDRHARSAAFMLADRVFSCDRNGRKEVTVVRVMSPGRPA